MRKLKQRVFEVIQPAAEGCIASRVFDVAIMVLIAGSIVSVFATTFSLSKTELRCFGAFETVSVLIFTVEYLLRIWTADLLHPDETPFRARLRYIRSGMALIDLLAILPFYLPMILPVNLLGLRAIRLVRLLRIFKLNRYSDALISIGRVFAEKSREIAASLFFVAILLVIASLLIYHAEHDAQPEQFKNAFSGLWWAVATLTTVGYGDIYPITPLGRVLGAVIAILGIGVVAVPTGILSAGFMEHLKGGSDSDSGNYCPHCGKKLK